MSCNVKISLFQRMSTDFTNFFVDFFRECLSLVYICFTFENAYWWWCWYNFQIEIESLLCDLIDLTSKSLHNLKEHLLSSLPIIHSRYYSCAFLSFFFFTCHRSLTLNEKLSIFYSTTRYIVFLQCIMFPQQYVSIMIIICIIQLFNRQK